MEKRAFFKKAPASFFRKASVWNWVRRGMDWEKADRPDEYAAFFAELMLRADPLFKEGALPISAENGLLKMRRGEGKNALTLLLNAGKEGVPFSKIRKEILSRNIDGDTLLRKGILIYRG